MASQSDLLKQKKEKRKRKPDFNRQDYYIRKKMHNRPGWRKPRGKHSKMREDRAGKRPRVKVGYKMPASVRGMHISGLAFKTISGINDLKSFDANKEIAVLSGKIGLKKKFEIAKEAQKSGVKFSNIQIEKIISKAEEKKKAKQSKKEEKKEETSTKQESEENKEKHIEYEKEKTAEKTEEKKEKLKKEANIKPEVEEKKEKHETPKTENQKPKHDLENQEKHIH